MTDARAAKRRARRESGLQGTTAVEITVVLTKATSDELNAEIAAFAAEHKITYPSRGVFAGQILEAAIERARQARQAQATKDNLVQPATVQQAASVLASPYVGKRTPR